MRSVASCATLATAEQETPLQAKPMSCGKSTGHRDESDMSLRRTQPTCVLVVAAALSLLVVSCVPWQWEYLITANDRATEDEVRQKMGAPNLTKSLDGIESVWTYRYEVSSSFLFRRGDMVGGSPCIEYVLNFDDKHVLRHWVRQPC